MGDITSAAQTGHVAQIMGEYNTITFMMQKDMIRDSECS
jgi:hypothetical protein